MQNNTLWTVSTTLMIISLGFTCLSVVFSDILIFWMNSYFLNSGNYPYWFLQMFTSQFLHWSALHLAMNAFFVLYFWNALEWFIGKNSMIVFFISNSVFLWICLTLFSSGNTVGISGFAMALLSFYTLELYKRWNPQYTWGITALAINIWFGFMPGISLVWHAWWAIFWAIFWYMRNIK